MPECNQCGKPAIIAVARNPLCVSCYAFLQQTETARVEALNDRLRLLSAQQNRALAEMDMAMGLNVGRSMMVQIPTKPTSQYNTVHSVNVHGGTVGAINTGTAHSIAVAIGNTEKQGNTELAAALKVFMNALSGAAISDDQKREMSDQLGAVSDELTKPAKARRNAVIGPMLDGLTKAATASTALATLWEKLHPLLVHALQHTP